MFKVGDTVRVKMDLERTVNNWLVEDMRKYEGSLAKIAEIRDDGRLILDVDNGFWVWHRSQLESSKKTYGLGAAMNLLQKREFTKIKRVSDGLEINLVNNELNWDSGYKKLSIDDEFEIRSDGDREQRGYSVSVEMLDGTNHTIKKVCNPEDDIYSACLGSIEFIIIKSDKGAVTHIRTENISALHISDIQID